MRFFFFITLFMLLLSACSSHRLQSNSPRVENTLDRAEQNATPEGRKVLLVSRSMVAEGEIIKGSCWDFINEVYNRTGSSPKNRLTIFKSKIKGPFADQKTIQAGDWLYYINHSYKKIDHSGIFVSWVNFDAKIALIMSYAGERRRTPARYQKYDLSNVYHIIRPRP